MTFFTYVDKADCVCGASLADPAPVVVKSHSWGEVRFVSCSGCGSWNQAPQISVNSLACWYDSDHYQAAAGRGSSEEGVYLDYESSEGQRQAEALARYQRHLAGLFTKPGRVLEVGCASASLLASMRNLGWSVTGIDLSARFAQMAKRLNGVDVVVGDFGEFDYRHTPFDLVVMLGTVSNLQDFPAHLVQVRDSLHAGGIFYFNFPLAGSLISRLYGEAYWMFTPSVSTFFSLKGMRTALERAGFGDIRFRQDWQRPSLAKVLGQAGLGRFYHLVAKSGGAGRGLPFSLPIPGVMAGWARRK